uniref:Uncharacterized protein n=1 Tax=Arundo donax TaxID=35708 RepID=A0A0A9AG76_ARUDO
MQQKNTLAPPSSHPGMCLPDAYRCLLVY